MPCHVGSAPDTSVPSPVISLDSRSGCCHLAFWYKCTSGRGLEELLLCWRRSRSSQWMRNWQRLGAARLLLCPLPGSCSSVCLLSELKHLRDVLQSPPFLQKLEGEAQFWRMSNGVVVQR